MDQIPFDIWHLIFQLVCTDGGAGGCALARTSRSFRALSALTRFHTVWLTSITEVKNFLICVERIRRFGTRSDSSTPSPPITIRHLLLSFVAPTCDAPPRSLRTWKDYARTERALVFQVTQDHYSWEAAKTVWNAEAVLHLSHLLTLAAPTLRSLVLVQCAEIRLPLLRVPDGGFPALAELTLLADDRAFVRAPGPGALVSGQNDPSDFDFYGVANDFSPSAPPTFPALTHLHVVCTGPKLHGWERTLPRWTTLAPALTHLRVSQASARVPPVLAELLGVPPAQEPETPDASAAASTAGTLGVASDDGTESAAARRFLAGADGAAPPWPALRTVVVQMSGARKARGASAEVYAPRVVALRSRAYMPGHWEARLAWDWRERCWAGGCWTEDEGTSTMTCVMNDRLIIVAAPV
ncbi:uncharacterized protein BXZ73DRAFT_88754 [Epithele typhae]|uniref:uncharacterized protein n=1 Tax=Epithele typhae TaxID=378194 RepID=UPI0020080348|nr:uncharacterized protein BXZ73DRAFT_88754 [Epithele typhae]KAH9940537.1 hypothetical protein BXZ73DRAFT_88754 [Epithele typhae]